jgi:hypothetical protein
MRQVKIMSIIASKIKIKKQEMKMKYLSTNWLQALHPATFPSKNQKFSHISDEDSEKLVKDPLRSSSLGESMFQKQGKQRCSIVAWSIHTKNRS